MEKYLCDLQFQLKGPILQHRHFLTHAKEMTLASSITFYNFWWQWKHKGMNLALRLIFTALLLSQLLEKPEQPDGSNSGEEQPHILLSPDFWKSWDVFPLGTWLLKAWEVSFQPLWWSWHNLLCWDPISSGRNFLWIQILESTLMRVSGPLEITILFMIIESIWILPLYFTKDEKQTACVLLLWTLKNFGSGEERSKYWNALFNSRLFDDYPQL